MNNVRSNCQQTLLQLLLLPTAFHPTGSNKKHKSLSDHTSSSWLELYTDWRGNLFKQPLHYASFPQPVNKLSHPDPQSINQCRPQVKRPHEYALLSHQSTNFHILTHRASTNADHRLKDLMNIHYFHTSQQTFPSWPTQRCITFFPTCSNQQSEQANEYASVSL